VKLRRVLAARRTLDVVARTDASGIDEIKKRAKAYAESGADAILVDGIEDLSLIREMKRNIDKPLVFNQIAGGKSPSYSFKELKGAGVSMVIFSTPCLFAAQSAIEIAVASIKEHGGHLPQVLDKSVDLKTCNAILEENLRRRDRRGSA
jgi:2-methylisocitrate lyase-like PEP mutase family enzyme